MPLGILSSRGKLIGAVSGFLRFYDSLRRPRANVGCESRPVL